MSDLTSAERAIRARMQAQVELEEMTRPARAAFLRRFEREVDPEGVMAPDERARRVQEARHVYFTELGRRSAEVRWGRVRRLAEDPGPDVEAEPLSQPETDPWDGFSGRLF